MNHCRYCFSTENLTLDHKIPISQGGKNEISNYQCLCFRCNGTKSGLSHNQVRRYFRWFISINKARAEKGKKPLGKTSSTTGSQGALDANVPV